jgi:hypothetical protein
MAAHHIRVGRNLAEIPAIPTRGIQRYVCVAWVSEGSESERAQKKKMVNAYLYNYNIEKMSCCNICMYARMHTCTSLRPFTSNNLQLNISDRAR